ncbi:MAG: hypothetical protein P8N18_05160 [Hellea sp.]|nr:hypothetical protein [Hellea sp.]
MKNTLLVLLSLIMIVSCSNPEVVTIDETFAFAKKVEEMPDLRGWWHYDDLDIANGQYETYFENGQLKERGTYKDGKEDGPFEAYFDNGQLKERYTYKGCSITFSKRVCEFQNGKLNGPLVRYKKDGTLFEKCFYENGQEIYCE